MTEFDAEHSFAEAPDAQLATVSPEGMPHIVPVVFALHNGVVYTAIDAKRKSTHRLRRVINIESNPRVSLLADHYDDDWTQLWWVRADGIAQIHYSGDEMAAGYHMLRAKYVQYQRVALDGPVIAVTVQRLNSWHA